MTIPRSILPALLILFAGPISAQSPDKNISIHIVQDDQVFIPKMGTDSITLQQKTFKIQVLLQYVNGVYLFASLNDSLFRLPDPSPVPGFAQLPEMTMAEEHFNREKELLVSDEGWSYWFYDPGMTWHRFNKKIIHLDSGRVVGIKTVKQLYFLPDRVTRKLKENKAPLYLFFVGVKEDAGGKPQTELLRYKILIWWREEN